MSEDDVTAMDLFATKLPEITRRFNEWVIRCSGCKRAFEKGFAMGSHTEGFIPIALKGRGWQLTKKKGNVRILCPECKGV